MAKLLDPLNIARAPPKDDTQAQSVIFRRINQPLAPRAARASYVALLPARGYPKVSIFAQKGIA
jgi:hypothetical protein